MIKYLDSASIRQPDALAAKHPRTVVIDNQELAQARFPEMRGSLAGAPGSQQGLGQLRGVVSG